MPTGLPWGDPNSDPLGDIIAFLDREIAAQPNPLLRKPLQQWREKFAAGREGEDGQETQGHPGQ